MKVGNFGRSPRTLHPLFLDLGITAATEAAVVIAGLLVVSLFGRLLGPVVLGEYLLLRRVYAWLQAVTQLGVGGSLPRYVAHAVDDSGGARVGYFVAALACGGGAGVGVGIILVAAKGPFAHWLFGSAHLAHLVLPLALLLVGGTAHALVYGYYRGRLAMKRANALEFCALVPIPLGAVLALFRTGSVALIVSVIGVSTLVCAGLLAAPIVSELKAGGAVSFRQPTRELLRYGIPRVPGGFVLGGLFAIGPMIAAHYLPMGQVSSLLLGMSLLTGVSSSAQPLGLILLSKVSMVLAQDRLAEFRTHLAYLQAAVLEVYLFVCLQLLVFADVLVRFWVGSRLLEGVVIVRIVLLAIPFYLLFVSLRCIIDAEVTAYNTYNVAVSTGIFLALVAVATKVAPLSILLRSIAGAQVVGMIVLAWLTNRTVRRLYNVRVEWRRSAAPLLVAVAFGASSLCLHWAQGFKTGLGAFLLIELVTGLLFLGLLKRLGSPWLPFFLNLAFPPRPKLEAVAAHESS